MLIGVPTARAQVSWINPGAGDWFTGSNWSSGTVPTSGTAQINNSGTAQILTSGTSASIDTLILGFAVGQAGSLQVGTSLFFVGTMSVGESGTGSLSVSTGGFFIDNTGIIRIGNQAGSFGTAVVSGSGAEIIANGGMEIGSSGTGSLTLLNGGAVASDFVNMGHGSTASGTLTVTGTGALLTEFDATTVSVGATAGGTGIVQISGTTGKYSATSTVVGAGGTGTFTVSGGALAKSNTWTVGGSGAGNLAVTGTGTLLSATNSTASVTVGLNSSGTLSIQAGGVVKSFFGAIGVNTGGSGVVTISGSGSQWLFNNVSNSFQIGQSGSSGTGSVSITNGGLLNATSLLAYNSASINVDGAGSKLDLTSSFAITGGLTLGLTGTNNTLNVTNGATLITGTGDFTVANGSRVAVQLSGPGTSWTVATGFAGYTPIILVGGGGAGVATMTVGNRAVVNDGGDIEVDSTGTASLAISGSAYVQSGSIYAVRIGKNASGSLALNTGGTLTANNTYIGEYTGATGTATVSGAGTVWNPGMLNVGSIGGSGTVNVSGGARVNGAGSIGSGSGSGNMLLSGSGTQWYANPSGSSVNNFILVNSTGTLQVQQGAFVGANNLTAGGNGKIVVQDAGTVVQTSFGISGNATGQILNGAVVSGTGTGSGVIASGSSNAFVLVDGAGSQWNMGGSLLAGSTGSGTLTIQNGGVVSAGKVYIGYDNSGDHGKGTVTVAGPGSALTSTGLMHVGDYGDRGSLLVQNSGSVSSVSGTTTTENNSGIAFLGTTSGTATITGSGSIWNNTGNFFIGGSGTGVLSVINGGRMSTTGTASINALSILNIGTGSASGTFSAASVVNNGLIHFNATDAVTFSAGISGSGRLLKDNVNTVVLTGSNSYTGSTSVNAGALVVNGVLGNTAITVAGGASLKGSGSTAGSVMILNGGILAPGNSPGTLTVGSLTLNAGSISNFELGTSGVIGGGTNDLVEVSGAFTLDGTLNITNTGSFGAGVYRLFDYSGSFTNNGLVLGSTPGGYTLSIDTGSTGQVNLNVSLPGGGSGATWLSSPGSSDWNTGSNWTGGVTPNSGTSTAIFATSGTTSVNLSANVQVNTIVFNPGASAFTITAPATGNRTLTISGTGILNNSGTLQNFVTLSNTSSNLGKIVFSNSASAGVNTVFTNNAALASFAGETLFMDSSNGGNSTINNLGGVINSGAGGLAAFSGSSQSGSATITNSGGTVSGALGGSAQYSVLATAANSTINNLAGSGSGASGGFVQFNDATGAGSAVINNSGGAVAGAFGGVAQFSGSSSASNSTITNLGATSTSSSGRSLVEFFDTSTAGSAHITNNGGAAADAFAGFTSFNGTSSAGNATIDSLGGVLNNARGGETQFNDTSSAGHATITAEGATTSVGRAGETEIRHSASAGGATLIANSGTNGGAGGVILFQNTATGGTSRIITNGNGVMDISQVTSGGVAVGSIEGSGSYVLGSNTLTTGTINTTTTVSGIISGSGGSLVKTGTATLTLSGLNTYTGSTVVNSGGLKLNGSLATGAVQVNSGATFSGTGIAGGSVTIANGGILAPGNSPGTLTVGSLTLNNGSILNYDLSTAGIVGGGVNDLVIVNGALTLDGTLNITNAGGFSVGTYRLFNYTGLLTDNSLSIGVIPGGFTSGQFSIQSGSGQVNLIVTGTGPIGLLQYWDGPNTTSNNAVDGGSGTWNNSLTNWTTASGSTNAPWQSGTAIFSGASGTATLGANIAFKEIQFATDGYVIAGSGSNTLVLNGAGIITSGTSVGATISASISGSGSLIKQGPGALTLSGSNTYSGSSTLLAGTLIAGSDHAFGAGPLILLGGTLGSNAASGIVNIPNAVAVEASSVGIAPASSGTIAFNGAVDLAGGTRTITNLTPFSEIDFNNVISNGGLTLVATGFIGDFAFDGTSANTYTGTTTVGDNVCLELDVAAPNGAIIGDLVLNSSATPGIVQLEASNQIADTSTVFDNSQGNFTFGGFYLAGFNETIGALFGNGTVQLNDGLINGSGATTAGTLTVGSGSFSGVISDASKGGQLIKTGTGTFFVTGANTYTGGTVINGGNLLLGNGSTFGASLGSGTVSVNPGGTFTLNLVNNQVFANNIVDNSLVVLDDTPSSNYSLSGIISGTGVVIKTGLNTVTLSGAGSYSGSTGVDGGTLKAGSTTAFSSSSAFHVAPGGTLDINGFTNTIGSLADGLGGGGTVTNSGTGVTALFVGNDNSSTSYTGALTGGLVVHKIGSGTFALTGSFANSGFDVSEGSLIINGTTAGGVQVDNATFGGNATIGGDFNNNGIVAPGNSPGTINVAGNYLQSNNGKLVIQVAGLASGQHDLLAVTGTANLNGTLQLVRLNNFQAAPGNSLVFLTSGSGVKGTFSSVDTGSILDVTVTYESKDVLLEFKQGSFVSPKFFGLSPNQNSVARNLDLVIGDPRASSLIAFLDNEPLGNLQFDFDQMAPEELSAIYQIEFAAAQVEQGNLEDRMRDVRNGSTGFSSSLYVTDSQDILFLAADGKSTVAHAHDEAFQPDPNNKWGFFINGNGDFVSVDGNFNARGYDFTTGGITLGADYRVDRTLALGFAVDYAHTSTTLTNDGSIDADGAKFGIYATWFRDGFYLNSYLGGGFDNFDTRRAALLGQARGSTSGGEFNTFLSGGYDMHRGPWTFGPIGSFDYAYAGFGAFTENGSLAPLLLKSQSRDSFRTTLGWQGSYSGSFNGFAFTPRASASWQHEYAYSALPIDSQFASGAGPVFRVDGPATARDSALFEAGINFQLKANINAYLNYNAQVNDTYQSHSITGGVSISY